MRRGKALVLLIIIVVSTCVLYRTYGSSPTFGKTEVGSAQASEWNWGSKLGCRFRCPDEGTVTEIVWYGHVYSGYGSRTIYAAIYSDNNGVPDALLGQISTTVSDTWQWWSFTGLSVPVSADSYYWLVINWDQFNIEYRYDAGATRQYVYQGDQRDSPPPSDPFGGGARYRSRAMSIYATITASAAATIRGVVTESGTGNPIQGVTVVCDGMSTLTAFDGSYSFTVNLGSYSLTFSKEGYIDQVKYQDCPTQGEYIVDVLLQPVPTAIIRGTALDSGTANPVEGVTVTCDGQSTLTALDGSYSFTVNLGSYMLTFEKSGYVTETRTQDCPAHSQPLPVLKN